MPTSAVSLAVGARIRALRIRIGESQEEFGTRTCTDRTYINKIENGTQNITINKLTEICSACGISLRDFFQTDTFSQIFPMKGEDKL